MKGPPAAPAVAAPVFTWTGFYVGANVGGAWGSTNFEDNNAIAAILGIPASQTIDAVGVIGGVQGGYNFQFDHFVIGGELEFDGEDLDANATRTIGFGGTDFRKANADWLATGGLRLGYAADRLLFFVKGGAAVSDYRYQDETTFPFPAAGTVWNNATGDTDRWGWMIGGGVEWAFAANWTVKAEYDYIGFERQNITLNGVGYAPEQIPLGISNSVSLAKIGVNYKF
jgi:outer membrane immunogenic protein